MIPVERAPAPKTHADAVLKPGRKWLRNHSGSTERPPSYWVRVRAELAQAFHHRCGYSAMYEPVGTVDHYLSIEGGHRHLAYAWSNFRYAAGWVNSSKGTLDADVLDPFVVGEDWFELLLPSLQLRRTDKVPVRLRAKVDFTLERLHLVDGEQVIRQRKAWYDKFLEGKAPLTLLDDWAPLVAAAIRKQGASSAGPGRRSRAKQGSNPGQAATRKTHPRRPPSRRAR